MRRIFSILLFLASTSVNAQQVSGTIMNEWRESVMYATVLLSSNGVINRGSITDANGEYSIPDVAPGVYDMLIYCTGHDSLLVKKVQVTPGRVAIANGTLPKVQGVATSTTVVYNKDQRRVMPLLKPEPRATLPIILSDDEYAHNVRVNDHGFRDLTGPRPDGTTYIIDDIVTYNQNDRLQKSERPTYDAYWTSGYILTRDQISHMPTTSINDLASIFSGVYQRQRGGAVSIYGSR